MNSGKDDELNLLNRKLGSAALRASVGAIFLGLGLFGLFVEGADSLIPILGKMNVVYGFIIVGVVIELWGTFAVVSLAKRKAQLVGSKPSPR